MINVKVLLGIQPLALMTALFLVPALGACSRDSSVESGASTTPAAPALEREVKEISDADARRTADQLRRRANLELIDGLEINLWASERLLGDPVAINIDYRGRVWAAVTHRSNNSEFDIRGYWRWVDPSMSWETVEDRRAFLRYDMAPERSEQNEWLPDRNNDGSHDWRDLAVKKEEVWVLEDTSGNGLADRSSLFLRDFHEEITDVLGGLHYHNQRDELYLAVAPDAWRVKDTTGDGVADFKESISHGYGVHIGFSGHGMSGMTLGPDGRMYWSIGDIGANITDSTGRHWYYPNQGVIARSEPDGSNFEIFATGLRNTHEFTFDRFGNLITVDNDGDHEGERERLQYLVDGSDSGWRINWQLGKYSDPRNNDYKVWMAEDYHKTFDKAQVAHVLPPIAPYHNGPTGMVFNPGTALSEEWRDHFFVAEFLGTFSRSGINAFTLEPRGATFELASDVRLFYGIQATGLDFSPDGQLYFSDWVEGWGRNEKGRIWTLDVTDPDRGPREETARLLAEDFSGRDDSNLLTLLGHADMRVRSKAQFELVEREASAPLLAAAETADDQMARIHGLWGLGQLSRQAGAPAAPLVPFLNDEDPEIRAQAARLLGDVHYAPARDTLLPLLADDSDRVRFFVAQALGRIGDAAAIAPIVTMLEQNNERDAYLRVAGAVALERIGDVDALVALAEHPSAAVRVAVVVALQRLRHPAIARFLADEDHYVVLSAARGIADDLFIEEAIPALAAMLDQDRFGGEPLLRRAINATIYSGTAEDAARLGRFASDLNQSDVLRAEALNTLAHWPASSIYDRVTGRHRGEVNNDLHQAREVLTGIYSTLLTDDSAAVRTATVRALSGLSFVDRVADLRRLLGEDPAESVRIAALEALLALNYDDVGGAVQQALNDPSSDVRSVALSKLPGLETAPEQLVDMHVLVLDSAPVAEQQAALASLANIRHEAAYAVFRDRLARLQAGDVAPEVQLDLLLAAEGLDDEQVQAALQSYRDSKDPDDIMDQFRESLYGGDWQRGHNLVRFSPVAQCMRCHVLNERGSHVGPELTHVADRLSRYQLLQTMVDPHARIAAGYGTITVTTRDGETVQGFFEAEDSESVTVQVGDSSQRVAREDIVETRYSPSGMPAMGANLSASQLRDITEFLSSLKSE